MNSLVFEKLTQTLPAGASWPIRIAGDYFRLARADYPVTVRLFLNNRELGSMSGLLAGDYVRDVDFDAVQVDNASTAQIVTVQLAGGGVGSDRVLGDVSVIDGGKSRTLAGYAFIGYAGISSGAAEFPHVQLKNPSTSGVNAIVSSIIAAENVPSILQLTRYDTDLSMLEGGAAAKKIGAAVSPIEIRTQNSPALLFTSGISASISPINSSYTFRFSEPLVIEPGVGILVGASAEASGLYVTYEFYTEPA